MMIQYILTTSSRSVLFLYSSSFKFILIADAKGFPPPLCRSKFKTGTYRAAGKRTYPYHLATPHSLPQIIITEILKRDWRLSDLLRVS